MGKKTNIGSNDQFRKKMDYIKERLTDRSGTNPLASDRDSLNFEDLFSQGDEDIVKKVMVHRDTLKLKNPNSNKQYQFRDTDSDEDDGELTDEDRKYGKSKIGQFDDKRQMRGTAVMGDFVNKDQIQSKNKGRDDFLQ
jgi:hypothetical protein